jgi:hypothetical protein
MEPGHEAGSRPLPPKGRGFWIGIGLIATSFVSLAVYIVVPFLRVSMQAKVRIVFAGWVLSWSLFLLGMFLTRNQGYLYLNRLLRSRFRKS